MSMTPITLANLSRAINKLKQYFVQIKDAVKSVNGVLPDSDGDININRVNLAGELESYSTQYNSGEFIQRAAGGTASIEDGDAWLVDLKGKGVKTGYVEEVLEMTVNAIPREEGVDPITATIDKDTFRAAVDSSQTITLTYTTEWSDTPSNYGITVTGTPVAGDQIVIVYVKANAGTLTFSKPYKLISTGWNLYNNTTQMAKVVKYSDEYGYRVEGDYTSIQFSTTGTGGWSDVTVTDHNFSVPSDGYVKLTGGNSSNTAVFLTWSDWTEGYEWNGEEEGTFSAYSETEIDLSALFTGDEPVFPYGLLEVGSVQDEINLNVGQAISRIQVMENTEENMTIARQSGREYDYDTDYIFLAKATADTVSLEIDGDFTVSDHGIEYFETTTVPVEAQFIYGSSLKNKLERNVLTISQQTLTSSQKTQVQANLGINEKANISGQVFTGNCSIQKPSGEVGMWAKNTTTGLSVEMMVGSAGSNHGIYSNGYVDSNAQFHQDGKYMLVRNEAGNVIVNFPYYSIPASGSKTFNVGSNFRGIINVIGGSSGAQDIITVCSNSSSVLAYQKMGTSSNLTITTGTGTITIANALSYAQNAYVVVFQGTVS